MKKLTTTLLSLTLCASISLTAFAHDYAMSFLFGGTTEQYVNCVQNAGGVLNSVSPDYFEIKADGSLQLSKIDKTFISSMHEKGVMVIPFLTNHWDRDIGVAALNNTNNLTAEIAKAVYDYKLDGVNIDIENINEKRRDDYSNFVAELRKKLPEKTLSVSVAANPYEWQTGWHGSYDYKKLAENSDFLLVMSCDESYYGSKAGPVASAEFTEKAIKYALKHTTANKIVLGIPFFGRFWKQGEAVGGHGLTAMDIDNLIRNYTTTKKYHDDTQSAQVMLTLTADDTMPKIWGGRTLTEGVYDIWYDDMQSTAYKLSLVNKYKLKGSGFWALGQNASDIWTSYAEYKAGTAALATPAPTRTPAATAKPVTTPAAAHTPAPVNTAANTQTVSPVPAAQIAEPKAAVKPTVAPDTSKVMSKAARSAVAKGWLSEADYGEYKYAKRSDAIKMIMHMAALLPDIDDNMPNFADTVKHKDSEYIRKARDYGIVEGDKSGKFYPDRAITRQDLVLYLDRVFNLPDTVNFDSGLAKDLQKKNNAERYYAVQKYLAHKIVDVDARGYFHPNQAVTMGELAQIAQKLEGCGLKDLQVIRYEGQKQKHKILEPR